MLNITDSYGMVLKLEDKGNFIKGRLATSEKDKRDDSYVTSWWDLMFVGEGLDGARSLVDKDRIKITKGLAKVREYKDKDGNNRLSPSVTVFSFEKLENTKEKREAIVEKTEQDNLPF
jgi:hypothetical protein